MNKQSKDAADILQFGIAYPYGSGVSGDTESLWGITCDSRYEADVLTNRGKIDPREMCIQNYNCCKRSS